MENTSVSASNIDLAIDSDVDAKVVIPSANVEMEPSTLGETELLTQSPEP